MKTSTQTPAQDRKRCADTACGLQACVKHQTASVDPTAPRLKRVCWCTQKAKAAERAEENPNRTVDSIQHTKVRIVTSESNFLNHLKVIDVYKKFKTMRQRHRPTGQGHQPSRFHQLHKYEIFNTANSKKQK